MHACMRIYLGYLLQGLHLNTLPMSMPQASAEQLQGLLDRNSLPDVPEYCRHQPSPAMAQNVITYAHKLCYTTFAPPGYEVL